jgi:hypothetical protein
MKRQLITKDEIVLGIMYLLQAVLIGGWVGYMTYIISK